MSSKRFYWTTFLVGILAILVVATRSTLATAQDAAQSIDNVIEALERAKTSLERLKRIETSIDQIEKIRRDLEKLRVSGETTIQQDTPKGLFIVDSGGRQIDVLEIGSSLQVGAAQLEPNALYQIELVAEGETVSFLRTMSDRRGLIRPQHLWFQSGVTGCAREALGGKAEAPRAHLEFVTFAEAEEKLSQTSLGLRLRQVKNDPKGDTPVHKLPVSEAIQELKLAVAKRRNPLIYASKKDSCLINSSEVGRQDVFVTGSHFDPGELVEISIAPNQRRWRVGDPVNDVTGVGGVAAPIKVRADGRGNIQVMAWDEKLQRRGVYDVIVRRHFDLARPIDNRLTPDSIVSFGGDTALILFLRYPPGGTLMDIAGRPVSGSPYFEFADAFARTSDPVWGAVDPTYVPAGHAGGLWSFICFPHLRRV